MELTVLIIYSLSLNLEEKFEPIVTIQLPIYNEKYVVERLIENTCKLDYPKDKLEIQVLDDSTDETLDLTRSLVEKYAAKGFNIFHVTRSDRKGFKAGALAHGTKIAKGEMVAIFDADFIPNPDFIKHTIPYLKNDEIGMVQTRWGHINKDYSLLTKMQAFGLDAHFTVEQGGRNLSNSFINFNGTAGIWKKECILDAGGWSADTLTEDLDLSYRAQLKGWKFKYLEDLESPAELPVVMSAVKSQQYRWNKGAAETAKKNLRKVLVSNVSFKTKLHGVLHLLNSSIFLAIIVAAILSIPMLYIKNNNPEWGKILNLGSVFLIGFFILGVFYYTASKRAKNKSPRTYFLKNYPMFLCYSMGLTLHNSIAVSEGLLGFKTPFVRTPKFNVTSKSKSWKANPYVSMKITWLTLIEGLLCAYFIFGILSAIRLQDFGLFIFHCMLSLGYGVVFSQSVWVKKKV